jgi:hypothetical protein
MASASGDDYPQRSGAFDLSRIAYDLVRQRAG